ncbi:MAG: type II toxin-antitoxin system VapB family antitoxin [Deltaproteobacteria bacterium]|nr:type II toxin-antitoxin system VapB family antitoxin [Deltaproteobacteria bacterium]
MPTNLAINDKLLVQAKRLGKFKTKKETVDKILEEFVKAERRKGILKLFGKVDYYPDYDYKKGRSRR